MEFYGSDKDGLVCAYRFLPGVAAAAVSAEEVANHLAQQEDGDVIAGFLWLHFSTSNAASERWLREHLNLPDGFYDSLPESSSSTRVEREGDHLVAVFHDVQLELGYDASEVSTVSLSADRSVLVTARLRPLRSLDRLRASIRSGESFRSTAELLAHLLRDQADVLMDVVRKATVQVDTIEDHLLANRISFRRSELGALRRTLVRFQRLLAPEPAALFRLLTRPPSWIGEEDLQDLRQAAEEFSAAVADSAALVERVKLLQEELAAYINEQNNRSLFLLTIFTVLALPFNVIGGLFGMNVGGIPFAQHQHGFAMIVVLLLGFTALAGAVAFRRRGD